VKEEIGIRSPVNEIVESSEASDQNAALGDATLSESEMTSMIKLLCLSSPACNTSLTPCNSRPQALSCLGSRSGTRESKRGEGDREEERDRQSIFSCSDAIICWSGCDRFFGESSPLILLTQNYLVHRNILYEPRGRGRHGERELVNGGRRPRLNLDRVFILSMIFLPDGPSNIPPLVSVGGSVVMS
jgi:hypothetical protein